MLLRSTGVYDSMAGFTGHDAEQDS
jgi:hypothetical protein